MRLGMGMPLKDQAGKVLDAGDIATRARWAEAAGLDGIWIGDGLPSMGRPDVLAWLLAAGVATEHVELGTSIFIVPMRHPIDVAQRLITLEALLPKRFTIGVGAGSEWEGHERMGSSFETRFSRLYASMRIIRGLCGGASVEELSELPQLSRPQRSETHLVAEPWGKLVGGPRFMLGGYHSDVTLRRAAREYDGWIGSAGRTSLSVLAEAIKRYRDHGGTRAMVSSVQFDLSAASNGLHDDDPFDLLCGAEEARDRLGRLIELGFDDVFLVKRDTANPKPFYEADVTAEELAAIRELVPVAARTPVTAPSTGREAPI